MKNRNLLEKLGDFMLGKGFYIVLFLCVATIGTSGYYLYKTMSPLRDNTLPTGGDTSVVLPDSEANGPDPADLPTVEEGHTKTPVSDVKPKPQPDPEPEDDPEEQEEHVPSKRLVFTWPVKGQVLRDFTVETLTLDPVMGDWRTHNGLDLASEVGLKVLAIADGQVVEVYEDGLMGMTVVIDHGDGLTSTYANLNEETAVKAGDSVETGTVIGTVGDSAIAESGMEAHIHLEVWKDGDPVDPAMYLPQRPGAEESV